MALVIILKINDSFFKAVFEASVNRIKVARGNGITAMIKQNIW